MVMGKDYYTKSIKAWLKEDYKEKIFTDDEIVQFVDMVEDLMVNEGFGLVNAYHLTCEMLFGDKTFLATI